MSTLDNIRSRAEANNGNYLDITQYDRDRLLAALDAVTALAEAWHSRGESDMTFSKTIPDEYIAMEILTNGAQMVENARHIRAAITTALGEE